MHVRAPFSARLRPVLSRQYLGLRATKLRVQVLLYCDLAAGRCKSHRRWGRWQNERNTQHHTAQSCRDGVRTQKILQNLWTSKNQNPPQSQVARSFGTPSQLIQLPDPPLYCSLIHIHLSDTEVLSRRLIGTCTRLDSIRNTSQCIWTESLYFRAKYKEKQWFCS